MVSAAVALLGTFFEDRDGRGRGRAAGMQRWIHPLSPPFGVVSFDSGVLVGFLWLRWGVFLFGVFGDFWCLFMVFFVLDQ